MNQEDEPAFEAILKEMHNALDKPLSQSTKDVFIRAFKNVNINEIARARDLLLKDLQEKPAPRHFTVADLWDLKRRLRAHAPSPAVQAEEAWLGDDWDIIANQRLLIYIRWKGSRRVTYTSDDTKVAAEIIAPLVGYKKAWAVDCREYEEEHGEPPPQDLQRSWWISCIKRAEEQIKEIRERESIPCPAS